MTDYRTFKQGSEDYLVLPVVDETGEDLTDSIPVAVTLDDGATWLTAAWTGTESPTRNAQVLLDTAEMDTGLYDVYVRLTVPPVAPIEHAGQIQIVP